MAEFTAVATPAVREPHAIVDVLTDGLLDLQCVLGREAGAPARIRDERLRYC